MKNDREIRTTDMRAEELYLLAFQHLYTTAKPVM